MLFFTENRQTKTKLCTLFTFLFLLLSLQSCAQENEKQSSEKMVTTDYSQVDYSKPSNIIKAPEKLTGDEKAIFYHQPFIILSSTEVKNLNPLIVKKEFAKLGITTDQRARFVAAYTFFDIKYWGHKKSCEQWESFKDLAPQSNN